MSDPRSTPTASEAAARDLALCRAALYEAASLGFQAPAAETRLRLLDPEAACALAAAARVLDGGDPSASLAERAAALGRPDAGLEELSLAHQRLFGHTARGIVSPYETEYGEEVLFQQPQELSDLQGFLHAFGLELRSGAHERIDHVSCECEFLAFLAAKEAYAIETGDGEMRAVTARAYRLFLRDHLGRFAPTFSHLVERADAGGFFAAVAALLGALVGWDASRLDVRVGSDRLGLRPDPSTVEVPAGCGECPAAEAE